MWLWPRISSVVALLQKPGLSLNRVFRDKPGGLVVDYLGVAD
mgnify:CR=1 FL=1